MMYGQMTAGSWIYIGSQGIVQGTYETFVEAGPPALRRRAWRGRWILTAGLGGMGGAQPLAATLRRRVVARHRVPAVAHRLPPALALPRRAGERPRRRARAHRAPHASEARGLGRPARQRRRDRARAAAPRAGGRPAARPRHRPDLGARPRQRLPARRLDGRAMAGGAGRAGAARGAARGGGAELRDARAGDARLPASSGVPIVDYGNNIRQVAFDQGVADAFEFPGFVPAYIRPLFCRGKGPFRWVALSGDPEDIRKTDAKMKELFPERRAPAPLARHGRRAHRVPGPAGAHLLARPRRARTAPASPSTRW